MSFEIILNLAQLAANPVVQKLVAGTIELVGGIISPDAPLPAPNVAGAIPSELSLTHVDRRIAAGLTKRDGRIVVALLVERANTFAEKKAVSVSERGGDAVVHIVTGEAQSSKPDTALKKGMHKGVGASIGHINGYPGSVGGIVKLASGHLALTSAAHVLSRLNQAKKGDPIILPGHPDGPKVIENEIGNLENFTFLTHFGDEIKWENILNHEDIAVVKLHKPEEWGDGTLVTDPKGGAKKRVRNVVTKDQILDYIGTPVYKYGRTTDFTAGSLDVAAIEQFPLKMPNGRTYMYRNMLAIKGIDNKPFSQGGDSGALVYTNDFKALGFIVGGSDEYSFVCSAEECLASMAATLV